MATALHKLRNLQLGFESTNGTAVPATFKAVGRAGIKPMIERHAEDAPRGVRLAVDEFLDVSKGAELTVETDCTYEDILVPLESGMGTVSPTGAGPYVYTYAYTLSPTLKALTAEMVVDDGSTKHYQREYAYMVCREFEIGIAPNAATSLKYTLFGRAEQTSTVTPALTPISGRAKIPSNLWTLAIDSSWAGLGGTAKTTTLREATLSVTTGVKPEYTLDGRSDLDMTGVILDDLQATLKTKLRHNAATATEIGNWRTGTRRFVRLLADNGAATGANRKLQIDASLRLMSWDMSDEDGQEVVDAEWELVYDSTASKALTITVTNGLTAQP